MGVVGVIKHISTRYVAASSCIPAMAAISKTRPSPVLIRRRVDGSSFGSCQHD